VQREIRTFGTRTADLLALSDWLAAAGVQHVAMESTGVYWKPIFKRRGRQAARRTATYGRSSGARQRGGAGSGPRWRWRTRYW